MREVNVRAHGRGASVDRHVRVRLALGLACACASPRGAGGGGNAQACAPSVGPVCPGVCACALYTERSLLLCLKIILMKRKIIRPRGPSQIKDLY